MTASAALAPIADGAPVGRHRVGVDVGGTFTDLVLISPNGSTFTRKVLSSTGDYARAILEGVAELLRDAGLHAEDVAEVLHGTTVATNAILERRGARTGLLATSGFRDVLEIGRLRLARLYDLDFERPAPLVPRHLRREVVERLAADGEVLRPLDVASVEAAVDLLAQAGVDSIAVSLLHAYVDDRHERAVGEIVRRRMPGVSLTLSSELLPEMREFERTSTAAANAYVMPAIDAYLGRLEAGLGDLGLRAPVLVMQSNGGVMTSTEARRRPVQIIESGPAAGVIATASLGRRIGVANLISVDMGGTTAKASVVEGYRITKAGEFEVGGTVSQGSRLNRGSGFLLRIPAIDIAEIGAGGGSIVHVDAAGQLHIGPRSAGAVPGPACYGGGGAEATLTDINVVLGYLHAERLPSGLVLDGGLARAAVEERVARPLGLPLAAAAYGVYLLGCARMARAVRAVSVERGRDPREFSIVAFGGNGPLFAAEMARGLGMTTVIVPPSPGVFSAMGLLDADLEHHAVRTFLRPLTASSVADIDGALLALETESRAVLTAGNANAVVEIDRYVDLRFEGQSYELTIALPDRWAIGGARAAEALAAAFETEHERTYGHAPHGDPVRLVNLRLTARIRVPRVTPAGNALANVPAGAAASRAAVFAGAERITTPVIGRQDLGRDPRDGPLLIDEYDATTLVPPGTSARIDPHGNIVINTGVA